MGYVAIIPNEFPVFEAAGEPRLIRDEDMVFRRLGEEMVLVPIRKGLGDFNSFYVLNEVGALVWEALAAAQSVSQLIQRVVDRFDVAADEAERDVRDFVQQLTALRAIRLAAEGEEK